MTDSGWRPPQAVIDALAMQEMGAVPPAAPPFQARNVDRLRDLAEQHNLEAVIHEQVRAAITAEIRAEDDRLLDEACQVLHDAYTVAMDETDPPLGSSLFGPRPRWDAMPEPYKAAQRAAVTAFARWLAEPRSSPAPEVLGPD